MPQQTPPHHPLPVYSPTDWAWEWVAGGLRELYDATLSFVPLPVAKRRPDVVLSTKFGLPAMPWFSSLPEHPPLFGQLDFFPPGFREFLQVSELFARGRIQEGGDRAFFLALDGLIARPGGVGPVVWMIPAWRVDPAPAAGG